MQYVFGSGLRTLQCSYMGKNDVWELKVLWFGIKLLDLLSLFIDSGFALMMIGLCSGMCNTCVIGECVNTQYFLSYGDSSE